MKRALCLLPLLCCLLLSLCGCGGKQADPGNAPSEDLLDLHYAEHFRVEGRPDGTMLLTLGEEDRWLLVPEDGSQVPEGSEIPVLRLPAKQIYLASSSVPDLFLRMDALDTVRFTGTKAEDWRIPRIREAVEAEEILYAGKYSAPDYELLLEEGCGLVVENTMIFHRPQTKEKLESLGFPVMVEYSSYEPHPLGRVEWIKLYGLLTGKLEEAEAFFRTQEELFLSLDGCAPLGKTVGFFHFTPNGAVVVRKPQDYVTRMIELAGGETVFTDLPEDDSAFSTMSIQMESFYKQAVDADILIYNSTVGGTPESLDALLRQWPLLGDFRAVREGAVWYTEQSMFQQTSAAAGMIAELNSVLSGEAESGSLQYLHRLT